MGRFAVVSVAFFVGFFACRIYGNKVCQQRDSRARSLKYHDYYNSDFSWFANNSKYPRNQNKSKPPENGFYIIHKPFPFYPLENSNNITEECKTAIKNLMKKAFQQDLDALKVLDATAKPSSGILRGNVNQYGDFDECLEAKNSKYCLAEIDITSLWKEPWAKYKNLVHSHFIIRETFDDPKHRIPGFTNLRWGFCIPRQCSNVDLENSLKEKWGVESRIKPFMCQISQEHQNKNGFGYMATTIFYLVIYSLIITSTYLYSRNENIEKHGKLLKILMAFSLQKNWNEITTIKGEKSNEIKAVHGVRFLGALGLIMSHKAMSLFYKPYINRTEMTEALSMKWSVIGRTAILFTDVFMILSGLLTANTLFSDLDKYGKMNFGQKLVNRIFRILPNLLAVILFCTYILPTMGSGPLWPIVVNQHSDLCKKYMWRNMLFIHNYFGFENMCLTHTHQTGIDMQLFLVTPIFVFLIWKNKKIGLWLTAVVATLSTILRFWTTMKYKLSHVVHCGIPISRMFDTANLSYIMPTHRATIYLMGVFLAFLLRYTNKQIIFSKLQSFLMWSIIYIICFGSWLGPMHMSERGYEYNKLHAAIYGAFSPIFWGTGVCWFIYLANRGCGSIFGWILTWKYFEVFSKISYALYLTQFPIFFYNIGLTRHVGEYKSYMMLEIVETGLVIMASFILTLSVELPFQNLRKILFDNGHELKAFKDESSDKIRKSKLG